MGGAITLELALQKPVWLERLILVATGARLRASPQLLNAFLQDYPAAAHQLSQSLYGPETPASLQKEGKAELLQGDPQVYYNDFLACDRFDVTARLSEIHIPTLVITGSQDLMTPPKYADFLAQHIPHSQKVIIPKSGHMVALEKPQEFLQAITDFLVKTEQASPSHLPQIV